MSRGRLVASAGAAGALALALAAPARGAAEAPLRAVILFTGDVLGYTEPCG